MSDIPTSVDPRAACPTGCEDAGPLCLLRHNGQLSSYKLVRLSGAEDLAEVVVAAREPIPMGSVQRSLKAAPSTGTSDRPSLHCCERSSPVKNRMLEIGTSGTVRVAPCKRMEVSRLRWRPRQSLANSRAPSLAWWPVTYTAKRRQGGRRPERK